MFFAHVGGEAFGTIVAANICGFILGWIWAPKIVAAVRKIRNR